jgi:hypothetical protein
VIAAHFEGSPMRNSNFNLIAFFQFERVDHRRGQAHGQAIPPLPDLHSRQAQTKRSNINSKN